MKKAGYCISLIGGILAIVCSVLLPITGTYFAFGDNVSRFYSRNTDKLGEMWADIGDYYGIDPIFHDDLFTYIDDFTDVLQDLSADDIRDIGEEYHEEAFDDIARMYMEFDGYLPSLKAGTIACVIASILSLVGAQIARRYRIAGGAIVLSAAALTLIFSLIASSIIPMALASFLLIIGGLLQIAKPKISAVIQDPGEITGGGI